MIVSRSRSTLGQLRANKAIPLRVIQHTCRAPGFTGKISAHDHHGVCQMADTYRSQIHYGKVGFSHFILLFEVHFGRLNGYSYLTRFCATSESSTGNERGREESATNRSEPARRTERTLIDHMILSERRRGFNPLVSLSDKRGAEAGRNECSVRERSHDVEFRLAEQMVYRGTSA